MCSGRRSNDTWWDEPLDRVNQAAWDRFCFVVPASACCLFWHLASGLLFHFLLSALFNFSLYFLRLSPCQTIFREFDLDKSGTMSSYEMRMALDSAGAVSFLLQQEKHTRICCIHFFSCRSWFPCSSLSSLRFQADQQPVPADHPALHRGRHDRRLWQLCHLPGQTGDHVQWVLLLRTSNAFKGIAHLFFIFFFPVGRCDVFVTEKIIIKPKQKSQFLHFTCPNKWFSLFFVDAETFQTLDTDKDKVIELNFFQVWPQMNNNQNVTIHPNKVFAFYTYCICLCTEKLLFFVAFYSGLLWPCLPRDEWTPL